MRDRSKKRGEQEVKSHLIEIVGKRASDLNSPGSILASEKDETTVDERQKQDRLSLEAYEEGPQQRLSVEFHITENPNVKESPRSPGLNNVPIYENPKYSNFKIKGTASLHTKETLLTIVGSNQDMPPLTQVASSKKASSKKVFSKTPEQMKLEITVN